MKNELPWPMPQNSQTVTLHTSAVIPETSVGELGTASPCEPQPPGKEGDVSLSFLLPGSILTTTANTCCLGCWEPLESMPSLTSVMELHGDYGVGPSLEPELPHPPTQHPDTHPQVVFPYQNQSITSGRGDCSIKCTDINTRLLQETRKIKETQHNKRNTILFQ